MNKLTFTITIIIAILLFSFCIYIYSLDTPTTRPQLKEEGYAQEEILFSGKYTIVNDSIAKRMIGNTIVLFKKDSTKSNRYFQIR